MNATFALLGMGVLLAWAGLPLLALTVRSIKTTEPQSRQGVYLWVLVLGTLLIAVPWVRSVARPGVSVSVAGPIGQAVAAVIGQDDPGSGPPSPLALVGIAWLWLIGAMSLRTAVRALRLVSRRRRAVTCLAEVRALATTLAAELGIPAPPVLVGEGSVPHVEGFWRPAVILPAKLLPRLDQAALELVLRHEFTHLARGDHRIAALISVLRLPLALHPTAQRLVAELALAREEAVDARVAPGAPHAYASLLVDVATLARTIPFDVNAVTMSDTSLARRIDMLTRPSQKPLARFAPTLLAGALLAGLMMLVPRVAAEPSNGSDITLAPGGRHVLHIENVSRLAIGNPNVADVVMKGNSDFEVVGRTAGTTTVRVWTTPNTRIAYTVIVRGE